MKPDDALIKKIIKGNVRRYVIVSVVHIFAFWTFTLVAIGSVLFTKRIITAALLTTLAEFCVIVLFALVFYRMNKKWANAIREGSESAVQDVNAFVKKGAVLFLGQAIFFSVFSVATGYYAEALVGLQVFADLVVGVVLSIVCMGYFFYTAQTSLFPLTEYYPDIDAINMVTKVALPISAIVIVILLFIAVLSYNVFTTNSRTEVFSSMKDDVVDWDATLSRFIIGLRSEISAYASDKAIRNPNNMADLRSAMLEVGAVKSKRVDSVFVVNANGMLCDSNGNFIYSSDRDFYKYAMTGKIYMSGEGYKSLISGRMVITVSYPILGAGATPVGVIGADILVDDIAKIIGIANNVTGEIVDKDALWQTGVVFNNGNFWYCTDKNIEGGTIGQTPELTDNGNTVQNIDKILNGEDNEFFEFMMGGKTHYGIKTKSKLTGLTSLCYIPKANTYDNATRVTLLLILMIFVMIATIAIPIVIISLRISKSISAPLKETQQRLLNGELSMTLSNLSKDELGLFMSSFRDYTENMKTVVLKVMDTVSILKSTSNEFESASRSLSEGTQGRAASVEEATAALEEVSSSVENINAQANEQARLSNMNYEAMEKLKNGVSDVLKLTQNALELAATSSRAAANGNRLMQSTIEGMDSIHTSTNRIAEMIRLITDISDQVNLLALNASIESARAGEQGKGFAVVAEEISRLADETAVTANNINELVATSVKEVARGHKFASDTNRAFDAIMENVTRTEELVNSITELSKEEFAASERALNNIKKMVAMSESINAATNEQMITNSEMTRTIEQINQGTLAEAARAEEISSSAADMSVQAAVLDEEIQFFKF